MRRAGRMRALAALIGWGILLLWLGAAWADITTGLVRHWAFDAGTGTTATDSSATGATGTFVGNATWAAGKVGAFALSLDGAGDYVTTTVNAGVTSTTAFSLCTWAYSTSNTSFVLLGTAPEGGNYDGVWFMWGTGANNNKLVVMILGTPSLAAGIQVTTAQTLNTWYHVCTTYNGSQTIGGLALYVNGSVAATTTLFSSGFGAFVDRPWRIGADTFTTPVDFFAGFLDDARVYNRVLSAGDVAELWNAAGLRRRLVVY